MCQLPCPHPLRRWIAVVVHPSAAGFGVCRWLPRFSRRIPDPERVCNPEVPGDHHSTGTACLLIRYPVSRYRPWYRSLFSSHGRAARQAVGWSRRHRQGLGGPRRDIRGAGEASLYQSGVSMLTPLATYHQSLLQPAIDSSVLTHTGRSRLRRHTIGPGPSSTWR